MKYLRVILIVLLLGCCTLWVASYWKISWFSSDGHLVLVRNGGFAVGIIERDFAQALELEKYGRTTFGYRNLHTRWWPVVWIYTEPEYWSLQGVFWLPTLLLALPLAISAYLRARRRRRAKQGLCIRCGYDLSGMEHEACPECGTEVRKANPA